MATTKKRNKKTGKALEFLHAISGFWPVWLSTGIIIAVVFGYQYYDHFSLQSSEQTVVVKEVNIKPHQIKIVGNLKFIEAREIKNLLSQKLQSGYLSTDLTQIRKFVESEAWVKEVTVKRLPPDILQLQITEQQPMLRWGDKGLISQHGEVFFPQNIEQYSSLAKIISDEDSIHNGLEFLTKSMPLMKKLKLDLGQVIEDRLGAWEIQTTQGMVLKFGRKKLAHRLQILEKLWPYALNKGPVKTIDLRYTNGAAVSYL